MISECYCHELCLHLIVKQICNKLWKWKENKIERKWLLGPDYPGRYQEQPHLLKCVLRQNLFGQNSQSVHSQDLEWGMALWLQPSLVWDDWLHAKRLCLLIFLCFTWLLSFVWYSISYSSVFQVIYFHVYITNNHSFYGFIWSYRQISKFPLENLNAQLYEKTLYFSFHSWGDEK